MNVTPVDAAVELLGRRKARESFPGFCEYRLPPEFKMAAHHRLMANALDKLERGEGKRKLMMMLPPGAAKSTYASVLFSEYFLGRNPQLSLIAGSHTAELAERFGRRVRNAFSDPVHHMLFNNGVAGDNSSAGRWETDRGGEYFAAGVGGSITGRRADLVVIDDPVRSREDADSERVREKTWEWYTNDLLTRLKPGGRIVICATRWHEADLLGMILEREREEWEVIKISMEAMAGDPLGREEGEPLWPEWFTEEMRNVAKRDARGWISLYQQEPRPKEGAEFKRIWINRYNDAPRKMNKIIVVDPAGDPSKAPGSKRKRSDRTVFWVLGLAADGNVYLVDGCIDRLNLTQRIDKLFELHQKHKPMQVRYERYGLMADIEAAKMVMEQRQYRFQITEVGGAIEKNARIRRLIPWFEGGRIWFPMEMVRTLVDGSLSELTTELIEVEYSTFPVGRYDDGMDCLARMCEPTLSLPWPDNEEPFNEANSPAWQVMDEIAGY